MTTKMMFMMGVCLLCTAFFSLQAQDLGNMLTEVADGIKPEAFKGNWEQKSEEWKSQAASLNPADAGGVTQAVSGLMGNLKGNAFNKGARRMLMKQLTNINGIEDIKGLLTGLVSGLKPSMLTQGFAARKDQVMENIDSLN